jgi:hypothetical protein
MMKPHFGLPRMAIVFLALLWTACRGSAVTAHATSSRMNADSITLIDARDTAAYAEAGPEAVAAVARCRAPRCRPDIFRGPAPGELTVGLDSGKAGSEYQWNTVPDTAPGGQVYQDSAWAGTLEQWATAKHPRLLLIDGVPRTYAYVRDHVRLSSVWGLKELSAAQAAALSSDPAAANGAIAITTKAHAPASR